MEMVSAAGCKQRQRCNVPPQAWFAPPRGEECERSSTVSIRVSVHQSNCFPRPKHFLPGKHGEDGRRGRRRPWEADDGGPFGRVRFLRGSSHRLCVMLSVANFCSIGGTQFRFSQRDCAPSGRRIQKKKLHFTIEPPTTGKIGRTHLNPRRR